MYREISRLVIYRNLGKDSILRELAACCAAFDSGETDKAALVSRIYREIHRLLDLSTQYGFDDNLWHCYLAYLLATNENPFSITCEKVGATDGSVNAFAKSDFHIFKELFDFDFEPLERGLGIDCFSVVTHYRAIPKTEQRYNKSVSDKVRMLAKQIDEARDEDEIFTRVTDFYRIYGVGSFGLNKAFRVVHEEDEDMRLEPIKNTDDVRLDDLVGYELQKQMLIENTEAFVRGSKANNCLLFGDAGTGKSTSIKAILNAYYPQGLRMIEIYKHQFRDLSKVIAQIKNRNYRFIIYMDDLSFEEFEIEYKYLKAVIEGGLETRPENVLIYATSNRRHLIRETWSDRSDMSQDELHHSDTMQEKLSLAARFGVAINYNAPSQKEYFEIVRQLAAREPAITLTPAQLDREANIWAIRHGGVSGRTAQQLILHLSGKQLFAENE